jgi:hypothetical protein
MSNKTSHNQSQLPPAAIEDMVAESRARSDARRNRTPNARARIAGYLALGAAVGTLGILGLRSAGSSNPGSAVPPEGTRDNVPEATMDYLESRPTREAVVPAGGGLDDPAYAVDGARLNQSADIRAGIEAILADQVPHTQSGVPVPQAGETVDVPVIPNADQIPPEAR